MNIYIEYIVYVRIFTVFIEQNVKYVLFYINNNK